MLIGNTNINRPKKQATGAYVTVNGEKFYEITDYDAMQPFFISLASDTDLWMYLSSTGGLTCGRKSPDQALFPYYTDDKITENFVHTGPKTILRVHRDENVYLWEPFTPALDGLYDTERSILKSVTGNKLIFSELNRDLQVRFTYTWMSADKYGWIRKSELENKGNSAVEIEFMDGLQNVLPAGTNRVTQNTYSTLVDGYKKTELAFDNCSQAAQLALFEMEAIMVDRAEPSESLRCNTIYCFGLQNAEYQTSSRALAAFRKGEPVMGEPVAKGVRGALFAAARVALMVGAGKTWYMVADVEKDAVSVRELMKMLSNTTTDQLTKEVETAVSQSTETLRTIVAQNDGVQLSADDHVNARHFANVLFNTMRGGFYVDNYAISGPAFQKHVALFNKALAKKHEAFLQALPERISYSELEAMVIKQKDAQLRRLFMEYLPLTFSRRHGDPSRPWNLFSIRVNDNDGKRLISYQGNWRDIFQNWEALSITYPNYVNGIIAKFFNATTIDGYNPYKVTSEGIDWEVINPDDPWSNIGYWGDHQIIYLLKLLELSYQHDPKALEALLNERQFAYANVPYRLKSYKEIKADPKNSMVFADDLHKHIFDLIPTYGQDARLVMKDDAPLLVTFTEKALVTLLTKLSNFIPEGGIWMNTLRPEWNDANNALVGYGASMVTLCYMRRYVRFLHNMLETAAEDTFQLTDELHTFYQEINAVLKAETAEMMAGFSNEGRLRFTEGVGLAGEHYRTQAYKGFSGKLTFLPKVEILAFLRLLKQYIDKSIRANKREDGLYNAYNIVTFGDTTLSVSTLYPMLEGQVAALTSGTLAANEVVALLDALRQSDLYRADQNSYMLYPARRRMSFLEKNNVPAEVKNWPDYQDLLKADVLREDCEGGVHFNPAFNNADHMAPAIQRFNEATISQLNDLYEQVFVHREFTGRSGTFYKYEGLGCIYWHMVSKLLLAVGENIQRYADEADEETLSALCHHYYAIQAGIGAHKTPAEYGSFPFDPYSHTPSMAGVQQPGMTGQVKEDILNRWFELGLQVKNGELHISELMLREEEFLNDKLCFTYCATPFEYVINGAAKGIDVEFADGAAMHFDGYTLNNQVCRHLFSRDAAISKIIVNF